MINKLLALGGIAVIVVGLFLLTMPISHIPLLDANRQVLAESEREGHCAGTVYVQTRGSGSEAGMKDCVESSDLDDTINHRVVQPAFCSGIISAGLPATQEECMGIMEARKFWPTMKGTLSESWNKRFPFPGEWLTANTPETGGESRTGEREETDREGFGR